MYYRDRTNFAYPVPQRKLRKALTKLENHHYNSIGQTFIFLLDIYALMKSKKKSANQKSSMTKTLRTTIMKCSELVSKFHKTKNDSDYNNYKK